MYAPTSSATQVRIVFIIHKTFLAGITVIIHKLSKHDVFSPILYNEYIFKIALQYGARLQNAICNASW